MILRGVSVSRLFCTDLSFWQSTRIYGAGRPIASSRNWRYSRLGTFPLPDDAHGLGFFDGSNLLSILIVKGYHPDWKSLVFNYGRNEVRSFDQ
jgi:hypothetical protein